ncbi:MAG: RHS repeat-associated core domain-containing protein [Paracoccaceae bacterium]
MATVSLGGVTQGTYRYDALGRQVVRTLASGQVIHSVFDSAGHRLAEYDGATGALIRSYVWLGDMPVAVVEGGQVYLVRVDHIGRPVFATTLAGTQVWSASYLPFGGVHVSTRTPMALRFPGQWFQMESGLHQNWMRDYDPTTGRYIEADPLGLVDGASVYGYARQNPGRYIDPTGEYVWTWPVIRYVVGQVARRLLYRSATAAAVTATATQVPFPEPQPDPDPAPDPNSFVPEPENICDGPCEDALQKVRDAKDRTGALGSCKGTDDAATLFMKLSAWVDECNARKRRDRICVSTQPKGGATPEGEAMAKFQACLNVSKCMRFLREK